MVELNVSMMPFAELLGVEILQTDKERIVAELPVRDELLTTGGRIHGGALMSFADTLGAVGAFLNVPEGSHGTTTIESKTNFLGGAEAGSVVVGECTPVHVGRRTSVWQTKISTREGKAVAVITQTQLVL